MTFLTVIYLTDVCMWRWMGVNLRLKDIKHWTARGFLTFTLMTCTDLRTSLTSYILLTIQRLCEEVCMELCKVDDWLKANRLSLNIDKTFYMIVTDNNYDETDINIRIRDVQLSRVTSTKFLGVTIDLVLEGICLRSTSSFPDWWAFYINSLAFYLHMWLKCFITLYSTRAWSMVSRSGGRGCNQYFRIRKVNSSTLNIFTDKLAPTLTVRVIILVENIQPLYIQKQYLITSFYSMPSSSGTNYHLTSQLYRTPKLLNLSSNHFSAIITTFLYSSWLTSRWCRGLLWPPGHAGSNFYCIALVCEYSSLLYTVIFFLSLSYILLLFDNHHTWCCLTLFLFFLYILLLYCIISDYFVFIMLLI